MEVHPFDNVGGIGLCSAHLKFSQSARTECLDHHRLEHWAVSDTTANMFVATHVQSKFRCPAWLDHLAGEACRVRGRCEHTPG